jgi:hypothetical protein
VLLPDADFGTDAKISGERRVYGPAVQNAANALTDAQVAVYPVDAHPLQDDAIFSAAQGGDPKNPTKITQMVSDQFDRENSDLAAKQDPMDVLAHGTGGRTCRNAADFSGCVTAASTAISLTAQAAPPTQSDEIRYLMTLAAGSWSFGTDGSAHKLNAEMITCVYPTKKISFQFYSKDLSKSFSDTDYQAIQTAGLRAYFAVPKASARRLRIAVLDLDSGLTGTLDIPVRPQDFANASAPPAAAMNLPDIPVPGKGKESAPALDWNPPEVDSPLPAVSDVPPCALPGVLNKAGERAEELVGHLQNFEALDQIRFEQTDPQGMTEKLMAGEFDYLVDLGEQSRHKLIETRTFVPGTGDPALAAAVDVGLPALGMIFHPALQSDYEMRCAGLSQWHGQPAWIIYFEQNKKKRPRTVSMGTEKGGYPVSLKGRAWIAADSGQVVHMETNLLNGLASLELRANSVSIDFAPVKFKSQNVEVWLPKSATVYTEYFTRRTIIQHTFSRFQLFSVQTQQVIQKPPPK